MSQSRPSPAHIHYFAAHDTAAVIQRFWRLRSLTPHGRARGQVPTPSRIFVTRALAEARTLWARRRSQLNCAFRLCSDGSRSGPTSWITLQRREIRDQGQKYQFWDLSDPPLRAALPLDTAQDDLATPFGFTNSELMYLLADALQRIRIEPCTSRPNVTPRTAPTTIVQEGTQLRHRKYIESMAMGLIHAYSSQRGFVVSRHAKIRPHLTKAINTLFHILCPGARYTTIQLNRNFCSRVHVDSNNEGPSWIIGLGDYTDGELWIYEPTRGPSPRIADGPVDGYPEFQRGIPMYGHQVDIRNKAHTFDGTVPHGTIGFAGSRVTLIAFTCRRWSSALPEQLMQLTSLGFPLPSSEPSAAAPSLSVVTFDAQTGLKRKSFPYALGRGRSSSELTVSM